MTSGLRTDCSPGVECNRPNSHPAVGVDGGALCWHRFAPDHHLFSRGVTLTVALAAMRPQLLRTPPARSRNVGFVTFLSSFAAGDSMERVPIGMTPLSPPAAPGRARRIRGMTLAITRAETLGTAIRSRHTMKFHWVAGIALWTIISGPAMYGSGPAPAARQAASTAKNAKVESKPKSLPRGQHP
jgi:hypothetical protein